MTNFQEYTHSIAHVAISLFSAVQKFRSMVRDNLKEELYLLLPGSQLLIELLSEGHASLSPVINDCQPLMMRKAPGMCPLHSIQTGPWQGKSEEGQL